MSNKNENNDDNKRVTLKLAKRVFIISPRQLHLIEANQGKSLFHIENEGVILDSRSLGKHKEKAEECGLIRVHRSYYISIYQIHEYVQSDEIIILTNHKKIPLGHTYKKKFQEIINNLNRN